MEKIKVRINWSGDNYSADLVLKDMDGVILVTDKTLQGVKKEFESAFKFHIDGCLADGDALPEYILKGEYEFEYLLEVSALLHHFDGILTRAALSRATGINQRQLGHYFTGKSSPRAAQRRKIIDGLHQIGNEFAMVE